MCCERQRKRCDLLFRLEKLHKIAFIETLFIYKVYSLESLNFYHYGKTAFLLGQFYSILIMSQIYIKLRFNMLFIDNIVPNRT